MSRSAQPVIRGERCRESWSEPLSRRAVDLAAHAEEAAQDRIDLGEVRAHGALIAAAITARSVRAFGGGVRAADVVVHVDAHVLTAEVAAFRGSRAPAAYRTAVAG